MKSISPTHGQPVALHRDADQPTVEITVQFPSGKQTDLQSKQVSALLKIVGDATRKLLGDNRLTVSFTSADKPDRKLVLQGGVK